MRWGGEMSGRERAIRPHTTGPSLPIAHSRERELIMSTESASVTTVKREGVGGEGQFNGDWSDGYAECSIR